MVKGILSILFLFFFFSRPLFAQNSETIHSFHEEILLNTDGTIQITEKILYDFSKNKSHGIYRIIPYTKYDDNNTRYDTTLTDFTVTNEQGKPYKFERETKDERIILKIGDPNKTISGSNIYNISYTISGALGYFDNYDELYWNITGNFWETPITTASAAIILPDVLSPGSIETKCFTGTQESTDSQCNAYSQDNTIHFYTTQPLKEREGLTTVITFPKDIISFLPAQKHVSFWEQSTGKVVIEGIIIGSIFWYLILPILLIIRFFRYGRDPNVGSEVTALYNPPKTKTRRILSPAETGSLLDEHVDTRDIFATLIDLAQRGYIKIKEHEKKQFSLNYTNNPPAKDTLLPFEKTLLDGIFNKKQTVKLTDVKLYKTVQKVEKMIYESLVAEGYFAKNPKSIRDKYYILGAISIATFNFMLALVAFLFGKNMPRKTLFGAQSAQIAQGMKNFLNSQERQLNFQGDKQLFFERLLPFAVSFGVEKNWTNRFQKFDLQSPNWYMSTTSSTFHVAHFASTLSQSQKNFHSSSTPPSSSSSGFSGGFSGGGGGGGGGGSW